MYDFLFDRNKNSGTMEISLNQFWRNNGSASRNWYTNSFNKEIPMTVYREYYLSLPEAHQFYMVLCVIHNIIYWSHYWFAAYNNFLKTIYYFTCYHDHNTLSASAAWIIKYTYPFDRPWTYPSSGASAYPWAEAKKPKNTKSDSDKRQKKKNSTKKLMSFTTRINQHIR